MWKTMSSFQKTIMNPYTSKIHPKLLFLNMTVVYCNMDNLKFDNDNVQYGFII